MTDRDPPDVTDGDAPDGLWEGDVNDAVVEEWTADTTALDRVRQVADVTTEPRTASEVAERARVSEPTARKHLRAMVDVGRVEAVESDAGTRYVRSPRAIAMRRIAAIHREHTRDEVRAGIREIKEGLSDLRDRYDVADVDGLAIELAAGDDGWRDVARWRQLEENLAVARAALSLYDFDPDDSDAARSPVGDDAPDDSREYGALGDGRTGPA